MDCQDSNRFYFLPFLAFLDSVLPRPGFNLRRPSRISTSSSSRFSTSFPPGIRLLADPDIQSSSFFLLSLSRISTDLDFHDGPHQFFKIVVSIGRFLIIIRPPPPSIGSIFNYNKTLSLIHI